MEKRGEVTVGWMLGLHIRPATKIVKLLKNYSCDIKLFKDSNICDARSVMQLLTLEAWTGDSLQIHAVGDDAEDAVNALSRFFREYRDEEEGLGYPF